MFLTMSLAVAVKCVYFHAVMHAHQIYVSLSLIVCINTGSQTHTSNQLSTQTMINEATPCLSSFRARAAREKNKISSLISLSLSYTSTLRHIKSKL